VKTRISSGDTVLFIGDSITDCGRRDDRGRPLGLGYVQFFADLMTIREPEKTVAILNRGIGGNTVEDLRSRWWDDVIWHKPDWLSIKIGINDANRNLCSDKQSFLTPGQYEEIYDQLLALTKQKLPKCNVLLIDPFFLSKDAVHGSYRGKVVKHLPKYIAAVHRMSKKYNTRLIKTNELFHRILKHKHPDVFGIEPVHPNSAGHLLMAEAVYDAFCR